MAQLVSALEDTVSVQYGQFVFIDADGSAGADGSLSPWELSFDEDEWLQVTTNGGLVSTGYSDHKVQVRFELWDAPPPRVADGVSTEREEDFSAGSGRICLTELVSDGEHPFFDLGRRAASWKLRALVFVLRDPDEVDWEKEGFPSGLERYCLQFWPLG
ncbi:hypothetical protein HII36_36435 [Nonomuraea sp. NN258]|uniref:hypothetical protein n=1 Tax=Nonomuraea antri TaxID=2730852 RepID=UPI001568F71F|nr:hypothetical protein [Nonomuraea antri]NRQ37287.1 hypothetical protein [Nonomuraea antri]